MNTPSRRAMVIAIAALHCTTARAADAQATDPTTTQPPAVSGGVAAQRLDPIQITGRRLDEARNGLSPETGSTIYRFDRSDLQALPLGTATPLNQIVLQAPGVVQDSYGQLHVRGDHSNLQYRIDGVVIPEAISGSASRSTRVSPTRSTS